MTDSVGFTCAESPVSFSDISLSEFSTNITIGLKISSPQSGSLQVLTRRQGGGAGDGVNIEENSGISIQYRGQNYNYDEAVFHRPGLHIFPGSSASYPAEYHIHLSTLMKPQRNITLVIPVKQIGSGLRSSDGPDTSGNYFNSCRAVLNPSKPKPNLMSILHLGANTIDFQATDLRGRTKDIPTPKNVCSSFAEHRYILVLTPTYISASDLERIPREGSLSSDPRDLPAPGIAPSIKITKSRLLKYALLGTPGLIDPNHVPAPVAISKTQTVTVPDLPYLNQTKSNGILMNFVFMSALFISFLIVTAVINDIWGYVFVGSTAGTMGTNTKIFVGTLFIMTAGGSAFLDSVPPDINNWIGLPAQ